MAMVQLLQHGLPFAPQSLVEPEPEDLGQLVGRQAGQTDLTGALEDLVNREVAAKQKVQAVLDLIDGIVAA